MSFSPQMSEFIDTVVNPFNATEPCQIPDGYHHRTICLQDWYDTMSGATSASAGVVVTGQLYIFMIGTNDLAQLGNSTNQTYQIMTMDIDSSNHLNASAAGGLQQLTLANYNTINGAVTGYNDQSSLAIAFRVFSFGMRLLPTVEVITDSSTQAVAQFYAGLMTPQDINTCYNQATNFYNLLRQAEYVQEFQNNSGVSVRLDPFQDELLLKPRSLNSWANKATYDSGTYYFPIIAVRFVNPVTAITDGAVLPIRIEAQIWIDAEIAQPTPIFTRVSPCDLEYSMVTKMISHSTSEYPVVTEGHSFKKFLNVASKISGAVGKVLQTSSSILPGPAGKIVGSIGKGLSVASNIAQEGSKPMRAAIPQGINTFAQQMGPELRQLGNYAVKQYTKRKNKKKRRRQQNFATTWNPNSGAFQTTKKYQKVVR
jgi:hypothetical protein